MKQKNIPSLCIALLIALGYLVTFLYQAPKADYNDPEFNLSKAEEILSELAKAPHPIATAEHKRVHDFIADKAIAMGYQVQQDSLVEHDNRWGTQTITEIQNIIIIKPGSAPKGTIAFAAHYDSQPNTLGAADDAAPIAVMLSMMDDLKNKTYENDIAFIITDGEETGLSGASIFTKMNPLAPKLNYLFNFEARGNSGPLLGFEPNKKNNHIMDLYLDLDFSLASSLMYDVYSLMPNDTDFTHFKKLDIGGISMAMTEGFVNYHSMTDTPENINKSSLYHFGKIMTQLIDRLGNDDMLGTHDYDMTYFNTIGYHSIQYKPYWNLIMLIISCFLYLLYAQLISKKADIPGIIIGIFGAVLFVVISLLVVFGMSYLIGFIYPHYKAFYRNNFYNATEYFLGFIILVTLVYQLYGYLVKKKEKVVNLHLGGLALLLILAGLCYFFMPTGSYVLIIPLFSFLGMQQIRRWVSDKRKIWIDTIALIIPTIILTPTIYLIYIIFSIQLAIIPMALFSLFMVFYLPLFKKGLRLWTMLLISLFIVSMIRSHVNSHITENQPYQANWTYINTDGEEFIVQKDDVMDKIEKEYFPDATLSNDRYRIGSNLGLLNPLSYEIIKDSINSNLVLRFRSESEVIRFRMNGNLLAQANNVQVKGITIKTLGREKTGRNIIYYGDLKNQELEMVFSFDQFPGSTDFMIESVQRGLIDILAKDGTIIPGTGYNGGTIIHRQKIKI